MAIRVMSPGKFQPKYTGTCSKCQCVVECIKQDLCSESNPVMRQILIDTFPEYNPNEEFIFCPTRECRSKIIMDPKVREE